MRLSKKSDQLILSKVNFMRTVQGISSSQYSILKEFGLVRSLYAGETLIYQNSLPHYIYYLVSGELAVTVDNRESFTSVEVNRMQPGGILGEMSLALDSPRAATVKAAEAGATVIQFDTRIFLERGAYPELTDETIFLFWNDILHVLKDRIDAYRLTHLGNPDIDALARKASLIRRRSSTLMSFVLQPEYTLSDIVQNARDMANVLEECNQVVSQFELQKLAKVS